MKDSRMVVPHSSSDYDLCNMAERKKPLSKKPRQSRMPDRRYVVKNEELLSPVLVDHSTLAVGKDVIVHSMFQTQIPATGVNESHPVDSVLVARFVYPMDYFRALTVMLARQYIVCEVAKGQGPEAFRWLKQELTKQAAKSGIADPAQDQ
jgi:hypothetical protein